MHSSRFRNYAWLVLAFNMGVILYGAYVRATGSGAGCGSHWPLCNGEVIPRAAQVETLIEFTHRLTSGMALVLVTGLLVWAVRVFPKDHPARKGAWLSMTFIITEALVGASLVLFEWVAQDASVGRAISMAVHLVNTFLLLGALALTVWWASGGGAIRLPWRGAAFWGLALGLLGVLVIGVSGALNALGDTLFPAASLTEGIRQDFSPTAHFLIRLRLLHPSIAVLVSVYLLLFVILMGFTRTNGASRLIARTLSLLVLVQLVAGFINVLLLAPVWMQIVHLFLADAVWITLITLSASVLSDSRISQAAAEKPQAPAILVENSTYKG